MMFNWLSHHILHQHFSICLISSWIRLQSHSQIWLLFSSRPDKVDSYQLEVSNVFADQFEHLSEDQPGVCDSPQCSAGGQEFPVAAGTGNFHASHQPPATTIETNIIVPDVYIHVVWIWNCILLWQWYIVTKYIWYYKYIKPSICSTQILSYKFHSG